MMQNCPDKKLLINAYMEEYNAGFYRHKGFFAGEIFLYISMTGNNYKVDSIVTISVLLNEIIYVLNLFVL